jgi:hypothetical protein
MIKLDWQGALSGHALKSEQRGNEGIRALSGEFPAQPATVAPP